MKILEKYPSNYIFNDFPHRMPHILGLRSLESTRMRRERERERKRKRKCAMLVRKRFFRTRNTRGNKESLDSTCGGVFWSSTLIRYFTSLFRVSLCCVSRSWHLSFFTPGMAKCAFRVVCRIRYFHGMLRRHSEIRFFFYIPSQILSLSLSLSFSLSLFLSPSPG